jgi:hypothetical protein
MSPIEYRIILKHRFMISLFVFDEVCRVCRKMCLDNFEEHVQRFQASNTSMISIMVSFFILLGEWECL